MDKQVLDGLYACRLLILDEIGANDGGQAWIDEAVSSDRFQIPGAAAGDLHQQQRTGQTGM